MSTTEYQRTYRARLRAERAAGHPRKHSHLVDTGMLLHHGGTTVGAVALCGFTWVPKGSEDTLPPCPTCARIAQRA